MLIHNASGRPDSLGQGDLCVSFAGKNGPWTNDVHLGESINTKDNEYCPQMTPDGKYFFFTRGEDIMWVDARVLDRFRRSR